MDNPLSASESIGISLVIVSYNVREYLNDCLQSILHSALHFKGKTEIIVFDNASRDGTLNVLKPRYNQVTWLSSDRNLGFGSGCNRGAAIANQPLLLFLNPDTLISEDTLQVMWDFYSSNPEMGAAGCKVVNRDGSLQPACKRSFPSPQVAAFKLTGLASLFPKSRVFGKYNLSYLDENKIHVVDAVSGSFLCVDKQIFQSIGGFDEAFFMYGEDLDLCYRIAELGKKNYYYPKTSVIHFKGESARHRPFGSLFNFYEAMVIFSKKHFELRALPFLLFYMGIALLGIVNIVTTYLQKWPRWLLDQAIINGVLVMVTSLYFGRIGADYSTIIHSQLYFFWHVLLSLLVLCTLAYGGEYSRQPVTPRRLFVLLAGAFLIFFAAGFFLRESAYSRVVFGLTALVCIVLLPAWRSLANHGGRFLTRMLGTRTRLAIIGTGARAQRLASLFEREQVPGYDFVGYLGFAQDPMPSELKRNWIGELHALESLADKMDLHQVIIALDDGAYQNALEKLDRHRTRNLKVLVLVGEPVPQNLALVQLNF